MAEESSPPAGRSFLEDKLTRLDAVYQRFGRDGLREYPLADASLLLSAKEMEHRDAPKGREQGEGQKAENRRLELEIKDLTAHVNAQLAAAGLPGRKFTPDDLREVGRRAQQQQQQAGQNRQKDYGRDRYP